MSFPNKQNMEAAAIPVWQVATPPVGIGPTYYGYEQIDDLTTEVTLTVPAGATYCVVNVEAAAVRWTQGGDDDPPTNDEGMLVLENGTISFEGSGLGDLRFIEAAADSGAILNVVYYGPVAS